MSGFSNNLELMQKGCEALRIDLTEKQYVQIEEYIELLQHWNNRFNLVRSASEKEIRIRHILDSLSMFHLIKEYKKIADLGSGAGLPGMILAIVLPDLEVISVEAISKKASFQRQANITLKLKNFQVYAKRVEKMSNDHDFQAVVSRAMTQLPILSKMAYPLLENGGKLFAMEGEQSSQKKNDGSDLIQWKMIGTKKLKIPFSTSDGFVTILEKNT